MADLGIGQKVWVFKQLAARRNSYRKGWVPCIIRGETSRSWIIGPEWDPQKIPKSAKLRARGDDLCTSEAQVDERCWVEVNRWPINSALTMVADYDTLRRVASLIGYVPKEG